MPTRKTPVEMQRVEPGSTPSRASFQKSTDSPTVPETERRQVVVVGSPEDVPRALAHPAVGEGRFAVAAVLAVDVDADNHDEGMARLAALLRAHRAQTILVAGPVGPGPMRRVADLALLHRCELLAVMPTETLAGHDPIVVWSGDSPLVQLARAPRAAWEAAAKRALDVIASALGLLLAAPLLALLAAAIRIESPGPALFFHDRVGLRGRRFRCVKLRTMRADAEQRLRRDATMLAEYRLNHFKIPDDRDPRVTPVGRLLRRASLDELPQLWNVLVGEMSLVGPRPVIDEELALYSGSSDLLLSVRPGITGSWAVSGRHGVGYPDRCALELRYVRGWTLIGDLRILAATLGAVLSPGATSDG